MLTALVMFRLAKSPFTSKLRWRLLKVISVFEQFTNATLCGAATL